MSAAGQCNDIAVIGCAGHFPGAANLDEFWCNVVAGRDLSRPLQEAELRAQGVSAREYTQPHYVARTIALEGCDRFDAQFFGYTPREAELMSPEQRMLLQCGYRALEAAGYDSLHYAGRIGAYVGVSGGQYLLEHILPRQDLIERSGWKAVQFGTDPAFAATHLAYRLHLRGPAVTINTACSTSLVAIHLACQSLLDFECDMALAGGSNLSARHGKGYVYQEGGILSRDGRCRPFDAAASGTISGSGAGVVLLKRLADAIACGDHIVAVVKGSAVNNDGADKVGFSAPSIHGQRDVILAALQRASVAPQSIGYHEAHGTATKLGDPIELEALTLAHRQHTAAVGYCALGALKANLGHMGAAAGIGGFIKVCQVLANRIIPPLTHFRAPNPALPLAQGPFRIPTDAEPWDDSGRPRLASISAFGMGGTNAHAVLCEAPARPVAATRRRWHLWPLSAPTPQALATLDAELHIAAAQMPAERRADAAYTLACGRRAHAHRDFLLLPAEGAPLRSAGSMPRSRAALRVALMFPGEMHSAGAAAALHAAEPYYRDTLERCLTLLEPPLAAEVRSELLQSATGVPPTDLVARCAVFACCYATAQLWLHWGLEPAALIGEGVGEFVAACVAKVLTLEAALTLLARAPAAEDAEVATARAPCIPMVSCGSGAWVMPAQPRVSYSQSSPQFAKGLRCLLGSGIEVLLESGPGQHLAQRVRSMPECAQRLVLPACSAEDAEQVLYMSLGALWAAGVNLPLARLYSAEARHRMPLPLTPLAGTRYWIERIEPRLAATAAVAPTDLRQWFYLPAWQRQPSTAPGALELHQPWLLVGAAEPLMLELVHQIMARGGRVVAPPATLIADHDDPRALLLWPPDERSCAAVAEQTGALSIIHGAALAAPQADRAASELQEYLAFVQASSNVLRSPGARLVCLSRHGASVCDEPLAPARAMLGVATKVVGQEFPGLRASWMDLDDLPAERQASVVLEECSTAPAQIALRGGRRWIPQYLPQCLSDGASPAIRLHGCYLITGGLGGIGLAIAAHFARQPVKLVLISRRELPPRAQWPALAASAGAEAGVLGQLLGIEARGSEVLVLSADVADEAQMRAAVAVAHARFGTCHGVVHAAGVVGGSMLPRLTSATLHQVLAPKLHGLRVLERVLPLPALDFVLLCSSQNALKGGIGRFAYAAANAYLDAYAQQHSRGAAKAVVRSVNWSAWAETGMAVAGKARSSADKQARMLLTAEALQLLDLILASPEPRWITSKVAFEPVLDEVDEAARELLPECTAATKPRPADSPAVFTAPVDELERALCEIWSDVLGIAPVGREDDFFQLGGSSLMLIQVGTLIHKRLDCELSAADMFAALTVAELADYLRPRLGPACEQAGQASVGELKALLEALPDSEIEHVLAQFDQEETP